MYNNIKEIKNNEILQDAYQSVFVTFLARSKKKIRSVIKEINCTLCQGQFKKE